MHDVALPPLPARGLFSKSGFPTDVGPNKQSAAKESNLRLRALRPVISRLAVIPAGECLGQPRDEVLPVLPVAGGAIDLAAEVNSEGIEPPASVDTARAAARPHTLPSDSPVVRPMDAGGKTKTASSAQPRSTRRRVRGARERCRPSGGSGRRAIRRRRRSSLLLLLWRKRFTGMIMAASSPGQIENKKPN